MCVLLYVSDGLLIGLVEIEFGFEGFLFLSGNVLEYGLLFNR